MPSRSKSQQRLFGMVHAYQKGKLKHAPSKVREIAEHISEEDAEHFAKTRHEGLPERRKEEEKAAAWRAGFLSKCSEYGVDGKALLKTAGNMIRDEIDYIREGVGMNPLTRGEAVRGAFVGGGLAGLAGAAIGAIPRKGDEVDKRARLRRILKGLFAGGVAGAAIAPVAMQYRKYMDGPEYRNDSVNPDRMRPGDKVYIGVSGSANGQDYSWFADEMGMRFPGAHYMLRHVDGDKLEKLYGDLRAKGLDIGVIGHSSGGKTVARFLGRHPEANGYLIDPVSWFGRSVPNNAVVFTSDPSTRHGGVFENYVADMGGRWNYEGPNSIVFKGSHSDMINALLRDFVAKWVRPGDSVDRPPEYTTSVFGKKTGK